MGSSVYRVLVIDDEEMIRNLVVAFLSKHGHICETAGNGLEALDKMEKNTYDAVVTDIKMPEMDGVSTTRRLLREYPDLPILVMTGFSREYCIGSAIGVGARDFIKKPFSFSDFMQSFNVMMRDQEVRSILQARRNTKLTSVERNPDERIEQLRLQVRELKAESHLSQTAASVEWTW